MAVSVVYLYFCELAPRWIFQINCTMKLFGYLLVTSTLLLINCKSDKTAGINSPELQVAQGPITSISLQEVWSTPSSLLVTPESVLLDEKLGRYYVSCIGQVPPTAQDGDGYISVLDRRGNILIDKWVTGLDAPKGMGQTADQLFVTDINDLVIIDKKTGTVVEKIEVEGAIFLNDISVGPMGTLFMTDMATNTIYTYKDSQLAKYIETPELGNINGLYVDHKTIVAATGSGAVLAISRDTRQISKPAEGIPSGDGIEPWAGGYIVSNWNGEIWYVSSTWETTKVMDVKDQKINTADITVDQEEGLLLVPTFFDNRVVAFEIVNHE